MTALENELRGEDNQARREVIKKKMLAMRAKIKTEKKKEQMAHVLRHLREGSRGKNALQEQVPNKYQG